MTTSANPISKRHFRLIFAGLIAAMFMAALDQMIFSTALPTIVGELHGLDHMQWIITAYLAASTITMPIYGKFGDRLGRRRLFILALALFLLGSVIGALALNMTILIAARAVQGLGGGGLMVLSSTIVADIVPIRDRSRYMGVIGSVWVLSSVLGPLLGGWFTATIGWRWAFWMNLPLGAIAIAVTIAFLRVPVQRRSLDIDIAGIAAMSVAVVSLVLLTSWGGTQYPWDSPAILGLVGLFVVATVTFVAVERRADHPIIPMYLLSDREFALATVGGLIVSIMMFGAIAYMPTYLQMVGGRTPTIAGLLMIPLTAGILLASTISGSVVSRTGRYKLLLVIGATIIVTSLFALSTLAVGAPIWQHSLYLLFLGAGIGFGMQMYVLVVQLAFPGEIGTATAANRFFGEIGVSLGSAIIGTLFTSRLAGLLADRGSATETSSSLDLHALTPAIVQALPPQLKTAVVGSFHDALMPLYLYLAAVGVLAIAAVVFIREFPLPPRNGAITAGAEREIALVQSGSAALEDR